jgi:hypothetical protein
MAASSAPVALFVPEADRLSNIGDILLIPESSAPDQAAASTGNPIDSLMSEGGLRIEAFFRGRMPSVSGGQATALATVRPATKEAAAKILGFANYLRCGVAGKSPPKAAIVQDSHGSLLLVAHRTTGPDMQLIQRTAAAATPAQHAPHAESAAAAAAASSASSASAHVPSADIAGSLLSKAAGKAAADDAPAMVYSGADASLPPRIAAHRRRLFSGLPQATIDKIKLDEVAMFSVSARPAAQEMTRLIQAMVGAKAAIIDGTACVGGNAINFAENGHPVIACEISRQRVDLLAHNMSAILDRDAVVATTPGDVFKRVTPSSSPYAVPFHGSVEQLLLAKTPPSDVPPPPLGNVLFLDPPWGGPEYKKLAKLSLYLGDTPVSQLLVKIAKVALEERSSSGRLSRLNIIALKGPSNLDIKEILDVSSGTLRQVGPVHKLERGKVLLLFFMIVAKRAASASDDPSSKRLA